MAMLYGTSKSDLQKRLPNERKKFSSIHRRNGSLLMELRCRGHRELIWELMHPDWLGVVQIESPDRLKEEYSEQLERAKIAVNLG